MTILALLLDTAEVQPLVGWAARLADALEEEVVLARASDSSLRPAIDRALADRSCAVIEESDDAPEDE